MASASPPPPPGADVDTGGLARLWARFRRLPVVVQAAIWVVVWPLLLALLLASTPTRERQAAGAAVLLVAGPLWMVTLTSGADGPDSMEIEEAAGVDEESGSAPEPDEDDEAEEDEEKEKETDERHDEPPVADDEPDADEDDHDPEHETATGPKSEDVAPDASSWTVTNIVDGDTIDVRSAAGVEERVRVVGIDTPERGECGFDRATEAMAALVLGQDVELVTGAVDDRDHYDRILRYVVVGGTDAGLTLIQDGLAIARYDSRDGYGRHPHEDDYVSMDEATTNITCEPESEPELAPEPEPGPGGPGSGPNGSWKNCTEARDNGAAPVRRGEEGYGDHLDRDQDGVGCE